MPTRSVFRDFITALSKHWRTAMPGVTRLSRPRGSLPMSSTFDAGIIPSTGQRVYLWFQHNQKVPGEFTINIILVSKGQQARHWAFSDEPRDGQTQGDGPCRISRFLPNVRHDKWWHLKQDKSYEDYCRRNGYEFKLPEDYWRPVSYDDPEEVIRSAVLDVSQDVASALGQLGARPSAEE